MQEVKHKETSDVSDENRRRYAQSTSVGVECGSVAVCVGGLYPAACITVICRIAVRAHGVTVRRDISIEGDTNQEKNAAKAPVERRASAVQRLTQSLCEMKAWYNLATNNK